MKRGTGLALLATLSGAFGINYEVLYYRMITARFGDMLHVHAAILASFLLAIALGARASRRMRRHLWLMEFLVGATALGVEMALGALDRSQLVALAGRVPLIAMALASLLVVLPAALVGMSVPLFTDYLGELSRKGNGAVFRTVYAIYNAGAALSVVLAEFLLIRSLGYHHTLHVMAAGNMLIGILLLAGFRELRRPAPVQAEPRAETTLPRRVLYGVLVWGISSSLFQMCFVRATFELIGPTRQVFALSLATVLLGFPLGSWLAKRLSISTVALAAIVAISALFLAFPSIRAAAAESLANNQGPALVVWKSVYVACFGLIPFACFGAALPIVLRNEGRASGATDVASAMMFAGLGNSAGYLLYVLVANRLLGELLQLNLVFLLLLAAVALIGGGARTFLRASPRNLALAVAIGVFALTFSSETLYRHHLGAVSYQMVDRAATPGQLSVRVVRAGSDNAGIVRHIDEDGRLHKRLFYLGHTSIEASIDGVPSAPEVVSGILPALFAPPSGRACVFGVGTGITAGTTARLFARTDAVEINEAVIDLLPEFAEENFGLASNDKARVIHDDARTFLLAADAPYDVILNSVSVPSFETASKVYTTEFFRRAKRALKPDGVYLTWIGLNMNDVVLSAILSSLHQVFRSAHAIYLGPGYYMLACSDRALQPRSARDIALPPEIQVALRRLAIAGRPLADHLDSLHLHPDFFATVPASGLTNDDDFPVAEFLAADPALPRTILREWPAQHSDALVWNPFRGGRISADELLARFLNTPDERLAGLYARWIPHRAEPLERALAAMDESRFAKGSLGPDVRARHIALMNRLLASQPGREDLRARKREALLRLAPESRDFADVQFTVAQQLAEFPEDRRTAERLRYRAIALDARFRNFAP